ncbi:unnamed protein product, partial [Arabidopsis halleri]
EDEAILPPHGSIALKKEIWKLQITPKIRHFLWRCLSGAVATATQLNSRTIPADPICQRCCKEEETINHILFTCPFADVVWRQVNGIVGQLNFSTNLENNFSNLLLRTKITSSSNFQRFLPLWIVWRLWKSRNDFLFRKITRPPQVEVKKGIYEANEWLEANVNTEEIRTTHMNCNQTKNRSSQWQPPPEGWLKCNFDSGFLQGRSFTNTGWLIRDSNGKVLLTGCAKLCPTTSSLQAEAMGFLHVLQIVWAHGMRQVWFEGDNKQLISIINNFNINLTLPYVYMMDIHQWKVMFTAIKINFRHREGNLCADLLAKKVINCSQQWSLYHSCPSFLNILVSHDNNYES